MSSSLSPKWWAKGTAEGPAAGDQSPPRGSAEEATGAGGGRWWGAARVSWGLLGPLGWSCLPPPSFAHPFPLSVPGLPTLPGLIYSWLTHSLRCLLSTHGIP